ncbi:trehalose synthase/amylase TreS-like [Rhipicephalus microplus]|uniref:trehalose synthase/amylase TreS-like n=1 Tax=Rhipicephalus microplus TaxID=6941 RepID=UPI003F6C4844
METDDEDPNYKKDAGCRSGLGNAERSGAGCGIFQITGNSQSLTSANTKRQDQSRHHHHHHHLYHQGSHRQACGRHSVDGTCRNNNIVISPTNFFQLEQVDDQSKRGLSLGSLFSTANHHAYTALTRALDSGSSLKSPLDSCGGESCIVDSGGSTTALLETVEKSSRSGGAAGAHKRRSLGDEEEDDCCDSACSAGWNWPAIRVGCLLLCVSCLVAVLCIVVGVLLLRPSSCDPPRQWWQGAVMYEVFVASFVDSDGDGFGDFQGLSSRLDYVRHRIGASALRLTSVFSALDYPLEYEHIIDFDNVDPHLGHMDDFASFVERAHEMGLRVVLDINPTVTSDQHSWAAHWLLDPYGEYANYYVPLNESAIMMDKAFVRVEPAVSERDTDDDDRRDPQRPFGNQLYLNWSHPEVRQQVMRSLAVWVEKGVDGFYLKHVDRLQVSDDRELYEVLLAWRRLLDEQDFLDERGRILMTSVNLAQEMADRDSLFIQPIVALFDLLDVHVPLEGGPDNVMQIMASRFAQVTRQTRLDTRTTAAVSTDENITGGPSSERRQCGGVANMATLALERLTGVYGCSFAPYYRYKCHIRKQECYIFSDNCSAILITSVRLLSLNISHESLLIPLVIQDPWLSWNLGDSESPRLASRLVDVDPLAALFTLWGMPGTVSLFYGDEIGMKDSVDQSTGRPFRTGQLGPMQWSDATHANFSSPTSRPWMPAHPDHVIRNVDNSSEIIDTLARAAELRSSVVTLYMSGVPSHRHRRCNTKLVRNCGEIFAMERFYPRHARYAVVANFAPRGVTSDLSDLGFEGNVVAGTCSSLPTRVNFRELYLEPGEALYVEITS